MSKKRAQSNTKHVVNAPLNVSELISQELKVARSGATGALTIFIGIVKSQSRDRKEVKELFLEAYEELADEIIAKICGELAAKYGLNRVNIVHAVGFLKPGDPIVFVAVHGRGREEAFKALQEAVKRYKTEPPLFKKEVYANGTSKWIEENLGSKRG